MSIRFRALTRDDLPLLGDWLGRPHVQRWWQEDPSPAGVEARYGPSIDGDDPGEHFVVVRDGRPVGMIQRYRLADEPRWQEALRVAGTPPDAAGVDYLIGDEALIGHGLGPEVIARFVADTWLRYPEVPAVVVDVAQGNRRSWRALEKVGFERVYAGMVESDDPTDDEPAYVYLLARPDRPPRVRPAGMA